MSEPYLIDESRGVWKVDCDCLKPCCSWRCTSCGRKWKTHPQAIQCDCGEVYVEWTNYAAWRKKHPINRRMGG